MEVVVTTPHGHADVDLISAPASATLADVVREVTGQAVPATARVDGRVVATDALVSDLRLTVGISIDTRPVTLPDGTEPPDLVRLTQVTGRGAGRSVQLSAGRYRFGTSRRLHAPELDGAPIETLGFELDVADDGSVEVVPGPQVAAAPGAYAARLDQRPLDQPLPWDDGRLSVAGRVFVLDDTSASDRFVRPRRPDADGTLPFHRRTSGSRVRRRTVIDAFRDADDEEGLLWLRRRKDPGAFGLAYGVCSDDTDAIVDLNRHEGVALIGSDRFTVPLARTLLIDAATMHGPADLEIIIATTADRLAPWNWAKWLPHVRRGDPRSSPEILTDADALERWSQALLAPPPAGAVHPVALLVLDDPGLWNRRDSPLHALLADAPSELRILAICADESDIPSRCTTVIDETPAADAWTARAPSGAPDRPGLFGPLARQRDDLDHESAAQTDIRPALIENSVAADLARRLAPLDDLEAPRRAIASRPAAPMLDEAVDRSAENDDLQVVIGTLLTVPTALPARPLDAVLDLSASRPAVIVCPEARRRADTVAAVALGAAAQRSPERLAVLSIGADFARWFDELPHLAGWTDRDETDVARLIHRVSEVLRQRPEMNVLVIAERAYAETDPLPRELVDPLIELAGLHPRFHVVLTADVPDSLPLDRRERLGSIAAIDRHGNGVLEHEERAVSFAAIDREISPDDATTKLLVLPTSRGRAMTPLERRLDRHVVPDAAEVEHPEAAKKARRIAGTFDTDSPPGLSLLPPPLPDAVDFEDLARHYPGDAIPIGLIDRPEHAENEVYWWQPGQSSLMVAGTPRTGVGSLLDLIALGSAQRTAADDLHVYAIDGLPQRRRAFAALPHVGDVIGPDDWASTEALVDALHGEVVDRLEAPGGDRPDLLLLVADLGRVRRALPDERVDEIVARLQMIVADGHRVGVSVVAIASRSQDLSDLMAGAGDRLVADLTDPADRGRLGAPVAGPTDRSTRRCWSTHRDRRVQLATPPEDLEAAIELAAPEPADHCSPASFVPGASS